MLKSLIILLIVSFFAFAAAAFFSFEDSNLNGFAAGFVIFTADISLLMLIAKQVTSGASGGFASVAVLKFVVLLGAYYFALNYLRVELLAMVVGSGVCMGFYALLMQTVGCVHKVKAPAQ